MKSNKLRIIIIALSTCLCRHVHAQENDAQVKGYVFNPNNEPAMYSTAILLNQDSVSMKGTLTGADGTFVLDKLKPGNYFVMIRNVEFETYFSAPIILQKNQVFVLDKIILKTKVTGLDEVVVKGSKAMVEVHPDKMVVNVANSVNASGNNGLELISKAPGVTVDFDKNIILQGKSGVQVYINGRPSRLSGTDLSNMLEGMQSDNIESLEIISNPSSKYDAEGTAGIINIVVKKNLKAGFNGNVVTSYSKGTYAKGSAGASLNYSGDKLNFFSNVNASDNTWQFDFDQTTIRELYQLKLYSPARNKRNGYNVSGGFDYIINPQNTISVDAKAFINDRDNRLVSTTRITDLSGMVSPEVLKAQTRDKMPSGNYNLNLHYSFVPDRNSKLAADLSIGTYSSKKDTYQPNSYFTADSGIFIRSVNSQYNANTDIELFSTQLDYEKKIRSINFSTGAKYSYISTRNELAFYNIENDIPVFDTNLSNKFNYLEKVAAAYLIMDASLGKNISLNAGLRVENTSSLGTLISEVPVNDNVVPRNYTSLFPNISISYDDKVNHALSFSIGRRITRPDYQDLNPFESKSSELSSWKGNPFLKPNYITNYQLSYSLMRKLVISNTYSITHDFFATIFEATDAKSSVLIPRNMQKVTNNGLSVTYPLKVFKWWEFSSFFIYNYERYDGHYGSTVIDLKANIYNFRIQNTLKLPAGITSEITYNYSSPWIWRGSVKIDGNNEIDLGIKKNFMKDRMLVQLTASDLLNTSSDYHFRSNYGGMKVNGIVSFDNHRYGFSLTYNFGNQKAKSRKKTNSAIDDELNRISD